MLPTMKSETSTLSERTKELTATKTRRQALRGDRDDRFFYRCPPPNPHLDEYSERLARDRVGVLRT